MIKFIFTIMLSSFLFYSCGTPNDPESINTDDGGYKIVSKTSVSGKAQDIIIDDSLAYIAQGEGGLVILNISDLKSPRIRKTFTSALRGYAYKIAKKDSAVYIASGSWGVAVVNAANIDSPFIDIDNLQIKPANNFCIRGDYLITTLGDAGISVALIESPTRPDIRATAYPLGFAQSACYSADTNYLFIACGEMGLTILDISNWELGHGIYPVKDWSDIPGYAEDIVLHPTDPIAFLACGTAGLIIIDYSDSSNIKMVSQFSTGGYAKELQYKNGKIFITTELRGLQVIDVTNVNSPSRIGTVKTKFAKSLTVDDKYIYIADEEEGLIIVSIP